MRSNLRISQFPSSSEGLVSILNKITKLEMGAVNKKKDKWNGTINKFLHTGNRHICLQDSVYDLARHGTLTFLCCFQSCDQQTYILWVKTLNGAQDRGFSCQSLNARLSWWHKLAIDTNISCIHLYIWEHVAMRKRFSKIHICVSKRLLIVFTPAHFIRIWRRVSFRWQHLAWTARKQNYVRFPILDPEWACLLPLSRALI